MSVKGVHRQTVHLVLHDDVVAVVGEPSLGVDVSDGAIGGGTNRINRLTISIALSAFDVNALVHLPALRADAAEGATWPSSANCWGKVVGFRSRNKDRLVGGR